MPLRLTSLGKGQRPGSSARSRTHYAGVRCTVVSAASRQLDREARAFARTRGHFDASAVRFDDAFGDEKTKSRALVRAVAGAPVALEEMRQVLLGDARAAVHNPCTDRIGTRFELEADRSAFGRMLDRVGEKAAIGSPPAPGGVFDFFDWGSAAFMHS